MALSNAERLVRDQAGFAAWKTVAKFATEPTVRKYAKDTYCTIGKRMAETASHIMRDLEEYRRRQPIASALEDAQ